MNMPIQAKPVLRSSPIQKNDLGVTPNSLECDLCKIGCSLLSGVQKDLCLLGCKATVC